MKPILVFLRPYRKGLILSALLLCLSSLCDLMLPTIMNEILNNGVYKEDMAYIVRCCTQMLAVALIGMGSVLGGTRVSCRVRPSAFSTCWISRRKAPVKARSRRLAAGKSQWTASIFPIRRSSR